MFINVKATQYSEKKTNASVKEAMKSSMDDVLLTSYYFNRVNGAEGIR